MYIVFQEISASSNVTIKIMSLNNIPVVVSALLHFDAETYSIFCKY
jgi:hypothetical protein